MSPPLDTEIVQGLASACPAGCGARLALLEASGVQLEVCGGCKGLLLDGAALVRLAGISDVEGATQARGDEAMPAACLRCNTQNWRARAVPGAARAGLWCCGTCGMVWLVAGELERLREQAIAARRQARRAGRAAAAAAVAADVPALGAVEPLASVRTPAAHGQDEPADRVSFERGLGNRLGPPAALGLALVFCSTGAGSFWGALAAMPLHELGHAAASWLSSRFAVPLPFFTVWHQDQSLLFGLGVATVIGWFGWHCRREQRRFGLVLALGLLATQVSLSWLVPARLTSMLQIMGGALGEIVLGALMLVAFHFPLPDRLRWDFWRWPALLPASLSLARASLLWARAARDVRHIPWGSAIGSEADGDMNRLVHDFGWRPAALAEFYLYAAITSLFALALTQAWMWRRRRAAGLPLGLAERRL